MSKQRLAVTISGFEPGVLRERDDDSTGVLPDRTIKKTDLVMDISDAQTGGYKSQEATIENHVIEALNAVLEALAKDRRTA